MRDLATGVSTEYGYDLLGRRVTEKTTTPDNAHNRNYTYQYNDRGEMVRWADAVTGMHLNYTWDAAGNLKRAYTDLGYDPDKANTGLDPNFRLVDHWYTYDDANRVTGISHGQNGELIAGYGYDAAGNRTTWNDKGQIVTYQYDHNGHVLRGDWTDNGGTSHAYIWSYDNVGNVKTFVIQSGGNTKESDTYSYFENNKQWRSVKWTSGDGSQTTTFSMDRSGRTTRMVLSTDDATITYDYHYYADGRESSVSAHGDASGGSWTAYDANERKKQVTPGVGNDQDRAETTTLMYNNDGQVLYKWHDDGKSGNREQIEYAYANGNAVGETGTTLNGTKQTKLDSGAYSLVQNFNDQTPGSQVTFYTTNPGDNLQSIATAMYGNPSLWFVIAEANGLTGNEELKAGTRLQVPANIKSGKLTSSAHHVYNEGDIIGSSLPNLKSEGGGGGGGGCATFIMIVCVVIIACVAPAAITYLAGAMGGSIGAYVVAGAIVGALSSIATQGVMIALGFQKSFDWKQVTAGALSGAFAGAAQAFTTAKVLKEMGDMSRYAKIASAALKVCGDAIAQIAKDGKITSWTSLAAAGFGQYVKASGGEVEALGKMGKATEATAAQAALDGLKKAKDVIDYITPWAQLAETYVRNDGKLTPTDWANAVGSTLTQAVTVKGEGFQTDLKNAMYKTAANMVVGGVLALRDRKAAENYLINAVGTEVGQLIGNVAARPLEKLAKAYEDKNFADLLENERIAAEKERSAQERMKMRAVLSAQPQYDAFGNPVQPEEEAAILKSTGGHAYFHNSPEAVLGSDTGMSPAEAVTGAENSSEPEQRKVAPAEWNDLTPGQSTPDGRAVSGILTGVGVVVDSDATLEIRQLQQDANDLKTSFEDAYKTLATEPADVPERQRGDMGLAGVSAKVQVGNWKLGGEWNTSDGPVATGGNQSSPIAVDTEGRIVGDFGGVKTKVDVGGEKNSVGVGPVSVSESGMVKYSPIPVKGSVGPVRVDLGPQLGVNLYEGVQRAVEPVVRAGQAIENMRVQLQMQQVEQLQLQVIYDRIRVLQLQPEKEIYYFKH